MIPKIIHLCWFSGESYPVEIKVCLDTWKRLLPDYTLRLWTYEDAQRIGIPYLDEALAHRKWAFAADVVRFYAVWKEGGIYMDSDIFLYRRFDEILPEEGFVTFCEQMGRHQDHRFGLQSACFMGSVGNEVCARALDYYRQHRFVQPDGSYDLTESPDVLATAAQPLGFVFEDREQHYEGLHVYPTYLLKPRKRYPRHEKTFGEHRIYGSWRTHKWSRRFEKKMVHGYKVLRYILFRK